MYLLPVFAKFLEANGSFTLKNPMFVTYSVVITNIEIVLSVYVCLCTHC
jgi:hypothetical protein